MTPRPAPAPAPALARPSDAEPSHTATSSVRTLHGATSQEVVGCSVVIDGVVQGVGFRPFVWRVATREGLAGWVANSGGRVEIRVEGPGPAVDRFVAALSAEPPRLARVASVRVSPVEVRGVVGFVVAPSAAGTGGDHPGRGILRLVAPDARMCDDCRDEVLAPTARRHGYPFTSCASCGPRYTVIRDLPYDRATTTLASFPMCPACAAEHADPADRRFGAEPLACAACGPQAALVVRGADVVGDPIDAAADVLRRGGIVAVKGLGGYQLACDARDDVAVARLRARKRRPDKPLAVLVADLVAAREVAQVSSDEAALLESAAGPIVLVEGRGVLAGGVAPGHRRVGLVLPTTPLHLLLSTAAGRPLVLTSGNRSEEPICVDDEAALVDLADVADAWLRHDRPIAARFDDSVAAVRRGRPAILRRARGTAPATHRLPAPGRSVLAVGADLQNAVCLVAPDGTAVAGPHVGDLDDERTVAAWHRSMEHLRRLTGIDPDVVVHDAHPDMVTTRLAHELADRWGAERCAVAHHEAHVAAVAAEHAVDGPVIGLAFDGFGWGADGTVWGGELLVGEPGSMARLGHLATVRQPGGDAAVRHPARMALAHAAAAGCVEDAMACLGLGEGEPSPLLGGASPAAVLAQVRSAVAAPPTSSVGRLLDAVAALLGVGLEPTYEGQPAILLEQLAGCLPAAARAPAGGKAEDGRRLPRSSLHVGSAVELDPAPLVRWVAAERARGRDAAEIAAAAHRWVADGAVALARAALESCGDLPVLLGGGVWANDLLLDAVVDRLEAGGVTVRWPREAPPGDGGLSLGQARVAAAHLRAGGHVGGTMVGGAPAGRS